MMGNISTVILIFRLSYALNDVRAMKDKTKDEDTAAATPAKKSYDEARIAQPSSANEEQPLTEEAIKALHKKLDRLRAEDEQRPQEEPVLRSMPALIGYAACDRGVNHQVIIGIIEQQLGFYDEKAEIGGDYYNAVVRFLETLDVRKFLQ